MTTAPAPLRCLVVDDDPLSVQIVRNCVENTPFLTLVGTCADAIRASEVLRTEPVDVLLLDVEMPLMSGLELLRTLSRRPQVILITSNPTYAVEAFEYDVVDFLVKPITYARFLKAAQKAREAVEIHQPSGGVDADTLPPPDSDFTFMKVDNRLIKIPFADVLYVEALGDYVHVVTEAKKHIVYATMKQIESRFPESRFLRVHRSFIVNLTRISAIEDGTIHLGSKQVPIGQTYLKDVLTRINRF